MSLTVAESNALFLVTKIRYVVILLQVAGETFNDIIFMTRRAERGVTAKYNFGRSVKKP